MTDPQKDDHIEELLGKLQGIFGKLSHSEEEEARQKIEIPSAAPKETPPPSVPPPPPAPDPALSKQDSPLPINLYAEPVSTSSPSPTPYRPELVAASTNAPQPEMAAGKSAYESMVPVQDAEKLIIPTAVYFSPGRETEARSLAQKLETMAPKFTKVAFRLRVGVFMPYDPKSDWKEAIILKAAETSFQTVFVVMDRALEDNKRKAIAADLEGRNIYFQEVPLVSIEKKAFYTDILLGLVFFFDSRKPTAPPEGA